MTAFRNSISKFTVLSTLLTLAACGGGGGGTPAPTALATGTFTKTYAPGSFTGNNLSLVNPDTAALSNDDMSLYLSSQLNGSSGKITSITFEYAGTVTRPITCTLTRIWMSNTDKAALVVDRITNLNSNKGSEKLVYEGAFTVPAGAPGDTLTFPLSTPFEYNGVDNLLVAQIGSGCDGSASFRQEQSTGYASSWTLQNGVGTPVNALRHAVFNFAGGDNRQVYGGTAGSGYPFTSFDTPKLQYLYKASDISGSGPITGIGFQVFSTTVANDVTYTMRLGHTTATALSVSGTWDDNITGSSAVVANNVSFTIPAGIPAGEWIWVPLPDNVFTYNGVGNLVVEFDVTAASNTINLINNTVTTGVRVHAADNLATGPNMPSDQLPNLQIRFNGANAQVHPVKTIASSLPLTAGSTGWFNDIQFLPSEIGTAGSISSISCRLNALGYSGLYQTLTVKMRQGTGSLITVHDALYTLTSDIEAGDWIDIPLTTPFTYDGVSALNVSLAWSNATAILSCDAGGDNTLYLNRVVSGDVAPFSVGTSSNVLPAMKFKIDK